MASLLGLLPSFSGNGRPRGSSICVHMLGEMHDLFLPRHGAAVDASSHFGESYMSAYIQYSLKSVLAFVKGHLSFPCRAQAKIDTTLWPFPGHVPKPCALGLGPFPQTLFPLLKPQTLCPAPVPRSLALCPNTRPYTVGPGPVPKTLCPVPEFGTPVPCALDPVFPPRPCAPATIPCDSVPDQTPVRSAPGSR